MESILDRGHGELDDAGVDPADERGTGRPSAPY
jgi:hypothetical protein